MAIASSPACAISTRPRRCAMRQRRMACPSTSSNSTSRRRHRATAPLHARLRPDRSTVLVNNAGIGGATPLELTPEAEHRQMFETNYFGAVRCIQAVLPGMRERRSGAIVNITSIAGLIATPNQVAYSASKWALECLGEALAHEVYRFGVRVVNVEPGVIMTSIFENSQGATRYDKTSPYQPIMRRNGKLFAAGFRDATQPDVVAARDLRRDHDTRLSTALARRQGRGRSREGASADHRRRVGAHGRRRQRSGVQRLVLRTLRRQALTEVAGGGFEQYGCRHQWRGRMDPAERDQQRRTRCELQRLRRSLQRAARLRNCPRRARSQTAFERRVHRKGVRHQEPLCLHKGRHPRHRMYASAHSAARRRRTFAPGRDGVARGSPRADRGKQDAGRHRHGDRLVRIHRACLSRDRDRSTGGARHRRLRFRHARRVFGRDLRTATRARRARRGQRARRARDQSGTHVAAGELLRSRQPLHLRRRQHGSGARTGIHRDCAARVSRARQQGGHAVLEQHPFELRLSRARRRRRRVRRRRGCSTRTVAKCSRKSARWRRRTSKRRSQRSD